MLSTQALFFLSLATAAVGGDERRHPSELESDRVPALRTGGSALIRNVTIHSAVAPAEVGDVLVQDGRIARIGRNLAGGDAVVLDGTGRHLAPGAVDTHSHMGIRGDVNEATLSITADVDISDALEAEDLALYRALAGGTTTIQCLHGSANAIGGRTAILKLRWPARTEELRFPGAPEGVKFALGENPKRSNWGETGRYPATRMGVESIFKRAFERAREYVRQWDEFEAARKRGEDPPPPRRDIRLDALAGVLDGSILVHSHCYRADEILMLLRTAEHYGFRVKTLQHVLEGFKIAHEIAEHGAGASTFSDWWGYKVEAFDAIPHNAALMDEAGVLASLNSDSDELVRHLFQEAGKSVRHAGLDRVRALALVTINSARQLALDARVGSIEPGKDADLVLFDGDPLSFTSKVLWTMVNGEIEFQRTDAFGLDDAPLEARPLPDVRPVEAAWDRAGGQVTAIVGGTLHPITGPDIENGVLLIQDGRIVALGTELAIPADARVIDASGQDVWPGLIALNTPIGIVEIGSVRGTVDDAEIGGNQPDLRVTASIHPDSAHVAVTRANGVTRSQTAPQGGGPLMGQSAVVRLDGFTWEEMVTVDSDMLHVAYPTTENDAEKKDKEPDAVEGMRELFEEARIYADLVDDAATHGSPLPEYDPRLEALRPYVRGERKVALHAHNAQTILFAIRFAKAQELDAVLYGCLEGWKVADDIARSGFPVVVGPVLSNPRSRFDPYDATYANPAVLHRAGVDVAIQSADGENPRNLAYHAATAVAYGLPREAALRAVTLRPAEILGLARELGSLEPGKLADVIVTRGDLLDTTAPVTQVLIEGLPRAMENHHTRLYERYRERLHGLQERR